MTIISLDEFKKVAAELSTTSTTSNEQWLKLPTYFRQELLQKMLIALNAINENKPL